MRSGKALPREEWVKENMLKLMRTGKVAGVSRNALENIRESLRHHEEPCPEGTLNSCITYLPVAFIARFFADSKNPSLLFAQSYDPSSQFVHCVQLVTNFDDDDVVTKTRVVTFGEIE